MLFPVVTRKRHFPSFLPLKEILVCALIAAPISAFAAPVPMTHSAREQVNALVMTQAEKRVVSEATQKGWQDYTYKLDIFIPPAVANVQPCPQQPELGKGSGEPTGGLNRLTLSVVCPAANWQFRVTVKPQVYVPVVMAQDEITRGSEIAADRLVMKKYNVSNGREAFITDINSLVGMTAKRNLSPGRPITTAMLQMPVLVKRDQPVMMMSQSDNILIQTQGTALKDGRKGEAIRVRNDSSQRIVTATVTDAGVVKTGG